MTDFFINPEQLFGLFAVLNFLDVVSTNKALDAGAVEKNPFVARLMGWFGKLWFIPKMAVALGAGYLALVNDLTVLLIAANALYLVVILNNFRNARKK